VFPCNLREQGLSGAVIADRIANARWHRILISA